MNYMYIDRMAFITEYINSWTDTYLKCSFHMSL